MIFFAILLGIGVVMFPVWALIELASGNAWPMVILVLLVMIALPMCHAAAPY